MRDLERIRKLSRARSKKYYKNNLEERREYYKLNARKYRLKTRLELLKKLGNKCKHCGISDFRVLQIDHVNGGGSKELKGVIKGQGRAKYYKHILKNKKDYQILCANCNWIKRHEEGEQGRNHERSYAYSKNA